MHRYTRPGLLIGLSLGLASCGSDARANARKGRTVRLGMETSIGGFSPSRARHIPEAVVAGLLFEGLTRLSPTGDSVLPALASSWRVSPDRLTYWFTIRSGVVFHDGGRLTARDVERSWRTALRAGSTGAAVPWMLEYLLGAEEVADSVAGLRVVNDSLLEVRLVRPNPRFLFELSSPLATVPAGSSTDSVPVGTGPWVWRQGGPKAARITLVRNEKYWRGPPRLDSLELVVVEGDMVDAFDSGDVDCLTDYELHARDVLALRARPDVAIEPGPVMGMYRIVLDHRHPLLKDRRARLALALALDVPDLLVAALNAGDLLANGPLPPNVIGHDPSPPRLRYDPDSARALLAQIDPTISRELRLVGPDPSGSSFFADLIRSWDAVGFDVTMVEVDDLNGIVAGLGDLDPRVSYPDWADPLDYLVDRFHSRTSGKGGNVGFYANHQVDSLLDLLTVTTDSQVMRAAAGAANAILRDDVANVFLTYVQQNAYYHVRLTGCPATTAAPDFLSVDLVNPAGPNESAETPPGRR